MARIPSTHSGIRDKIAARIKLLHEVIQAGLSTLLSPKAQEAAAPMTILDDLMATLMETWDKRYNFNCDRKKKIAVFERHGIHVRADESPHGELVVSYEHAPHEFTQEICTVDQAAKLVELALFRDTLERLEPVGRRISSTSGSTGHKSWLRRILGL